MVPVPMRVHDVANLADPELAKRFLDERTASDGLPEELLAVFLRLGKVLLLRDYTDRSNGLVDRNLPHPGVGDGQEVDEDKPLNSN